MEPPLSVGLRFGSRPISGVAEFFRPSNLRKRKKLGNVKEVAQVIDDAEVKILEPDEEHEDRDHRRSQEDPWGDA
ncbi:hypothetical protein HPB52_014345 [Rhipicephalus sanguineus]|uniref:Uncharacterized protein n=1 Tax=Rhipicephalus sanguineus TaxID=34632 RepID=A0A9D4PEA5_RHISA|nr:hypothetical protein HPB52_014345 [Rhipicephalus sanguineus]